MHDPQTSLKMSSRWGLVLSILSFSITIALVVHLTGQRIASRTQGDKESINSENLASAKSASQLNLHVKNDDQVVRTVSGIPSSKSSIVEKNIPKQFEDQLENITETNNAIEGFKKWSRQYLKHNCDQSTQGSNL